VNDVFSGLEPKVLWHYFAMISQIPRGSGKEERIQAAIKKLGQEKGLEVREDKVGNVVLVIPAAKGCEAAPTVVLQGHVDMVWEKNSDTQHDFETAGIKVLREGEWITADGTTLGADNGVAVASALAMIDDGPEKHGELELLFTVDEERGLTGAAGVEPHMIKGRILLNMDSEEEGFVTVGCAGGGDTGFELAGTRVAIPGDWQVVSLAVKGLKGGHSGIDIHENRGNSIRLMGRVLDQLSRAGKGLRLVDFQGGSMRNAIPREATCLVAMPATVNAREVCASLEADFKAEFGPIDPNLQVVLAAGSAKQGFSPEFTAKVVTLLLATPTGVLALSREIKGLPETSTNLGVVKMEGDKVIFVNCTRSSVKTALEGARASLRAIGESVGATVTLEPSYPGWQPNLSSNLLAFFKKMHQEVLGKEPEVMAIHAGLECGILGERFPGMDMISFGPDMEAVHSPDERLHIGSTERFYKLLKALLVALAS